MTSPPENRALSLTAVNIAALTLALTITALRCFVRIYMLKAFGPDDWLMLAAAACFSVYCSVSFAGLAHGTGYHREDLSQEAYSTARMWWYCCYPTYALTMCLTKISMALFFRRVIIERLHKRILAAAALLTIGSCLIFFFASIFQCWPVSYYWDKNSQTGKCIPDGIIIALVLLFSVINIITDFTFALMPAWVLSHLNMKSKTKVALALLMALGCVASAAVVIRLPYVHLIASEDFLYDTIDIAIWSTTEQGLAITAGGLATLQPLVKLVAFKLGFSTSRPSLPHPSGYGNSMPMPTGSIAVKRSFTHRTETMTPAHTSQNQPGLKLQPMIGEYSAECYNTSQELLRIPSPAGSDGKPSKESERSSDSRHS
ncbi:hypothetical protein B0I37DRAFT_88884 [Chaetomium sp. MPI-CAGE-AT-0009]|nr:hypothetical protein B0I37DRAFT_88884 [Chaetomium sp. MPI-CAGE-AT-0009]